MLTLIEQLQHVMPDGMQVPKEIKMLYQYIEDNNLYVDKNGYRYGFLYPEDELKASWTEKEREGGTRITFYSGGTENLKYWFGGGENEEVNQRLCVFAQTGGDGSESAFWISDNGELKIVHMGSGSGSMLSCVWMMKVRQMNFLTGFKTLYESKYKFINLKCLNCVDNYDIIVI